MFFIHLALIMLLVSFNGFQLATGKESRFLYIFDIAACCTIINTVITQICDYTFIGSETNLGEVTIMKCRYNVQV